MAEGRPHAHANFITASGAFAFIASVLGYYCVAHYMCEESLPFRVPMGDTSRFFQRFAKTREDTHKKNDDLA